MVYSVDVDLQTKMPALFSRAGSADLYKPQAVGTVVGIA
jgi:hypothetical protein